MLNPQQHEAVKYLDGPLLVLAGAGSGKTRVITQKMVYLIEVCGYSPKNIFAVTFTNKAANEMRTRVLSLLSKKARRGLNIATFHTLGLRILKHDVARAGLRTGFSIFDSEDCLQLLNNLLPSSRARDRAYLSQIQQCISKWKNALLSPHQIQLTDSSPILEEEALSLFDDYQKTLLTYNAVDFDDLIKRPVDLLTTHDDIREYWQNMIRHLLIDEYQDSNTSQYTLVKLLVGQRAHFTVVGDDDQSIYAWRGARPENLSQLKQDYPHLKLIKLEQNYRSTGRILHAANQLISYNPHVFSKQLWSTLGHGELIRILVCKDEAGEAQQVIADLINHQLRHRNAFGDYAILYRGNHQSRVFEKVLRDHGIPYRMSGGQSWFARTEIRDIFSYLKLLCNESDDAAFLRVINTPKRGIGETTIKTLSEYANKRGLSLFIAAHHLALTDLLMEKQLMALRSFVEWLNSVKARCQQGSIRETLREMVEESQYEAYLYAHCDSPQRAQKSMDNVWELIEWVGRLFDKDKDNSLADIINKLILIDILEQNDENNDTNLQLMTLHASKGLEFPFIYLVGMEEELLPHRECLSDELIEEERRLAYVGITRAQKMLTLTYARQRRRQGEFKDCTPSRFLDELPEEHLEWFGKKGGGNEERSKMIASSHLEGLKHLLTDE